MHKTVRFLLKNRARPFLYEGLLDTFNHLYTKSSPYINSFSGEKKKKKEDIPRKTADDLFVASYILEE